MRRMERVDGVTDPYAVNRSAKNALFAERRRSMAGPVVFFGSAAPRHTSLVANAVLL